MQLLVFSLWILFSLKIIKDSVMRMDALLWNKIFFEAFAYYNPIFMVVSSRFRILGVFLLSYIVAFIRPHENELPSAWEHRMVYPSSGRSAAVVGPICTGFLKFVLKAMMVWLWGVNVFVFLRSRVNYAKVFDLDHNHLTHREIWKIASWVTVLVCTSLTAYVFFESYGDSRLAAAQPVLLYCVLPLLLALPLDVLYAPSRFYFLNTVVRLIFPFQPISFADFFVADVLTSMSKVLSDVERAACKMYFHQVTGVPDDDVNFMCGNHSYWIPCILAFPYLCRFFQCLRQYSDTRDKSCLFNALKYSTTFPVIVLSAMKYHLSDPLLWETRYRPLWLLCSVINTCYSFYWDVTRDWDFGILSNNCKTKKPLLRSNLLYNRPWVYYWAIASNLVLRCSWTFKLSAHLRHNRLTVFAFSALEMLRRFQWIFFRVESEYNKMITRGALSQIPLKELPVESERLLSVSDHDV